MPSNKNLPNCKDCKNYISRWQWKDKDGEHGECKKYPNGVFSENSMCERYFDPIKKIEI